jgi:hypothetical protein
MGPSLLAAFPQLSSEQRAPSVRAMLGIEVFLEQYIGLAPEDGVVLSWHDDCRVVATWIRAAVTLRGNGVEGFAFAHRDDVRFEQDLIDAIHRLQCGGVAGVTRVIVLERDTMSFREPLARRSASGLPALSVWRLINAVPDLLELALQVGPDVLRSLNAGLLEKLVPARRLRITTPRGTDLDVHLDSSRYRWVSNFGIPSATELTILPAGEVNTYPASISGRLVADGAFNLNLMTGDDARLSHRPVTLKIENGILRTWESEDYGMRRLLEDVFTEEAARNVGELGFGSNIGIDRFIALNSHINERHPGVHVGFGEHGQPGRVPYRAVAHMDFIVDDATIVTDRGEEIVTRALKPGVRPHPAGTHSEDTDAGMEG